MQTVSTNHYNNMTNKIKERAQLFKDVFGTDKGKEVLKILSLSCGLLRSSFVSNDPMALARNEGKREVILEIISILRMKDEDVDALIENNFIPEDLI
jgi:hypothetical protein